MVSLTWHQLCCGLGAVTVERDTIENSDSLLETMDNSKFLGLKSAIFRNDCQNKRRLAYRDLKGMSNQMKIDFDKKPSSRIATPFRYLRDMVMRMITSVRNVRTVFSSDLSHD